MKSNQLAYLLHTVAEVVDGMTEKELEGLSNLIVEHYGKNPTSLSENSKKPKSQKNNMGEEELGDTLLKVANSPSREIGAELLDSFQLTREQLLRIARLGNIHVVKEDKNAIVKEKIIESTVGSRLRSNAVRGNHG